MVNVEMAVQDIDQLMRNPSPVPTSPLTQQYWQRIQMQSFWYVSNLGMEENQEILLEWLRKSIENWH